MSTTTDFQTAEKLRQFFKYLNKFMLFLWRLGLGPWLSLWPQGFGRYMVITHTGRKTGQKRQTPVNYTVVAGDVYCVAGFGTRSDWYRNMMVHPEVEVWLQDGWYQGLAEDVSEIENRLEILRAVTIDSGFATPLFEGFDPKKISDEELDSRTKSYHLVCIRPTTACTGPEGPGDLAWVWPLATMILLPVVILRRRKS